ncbi:MAG: DUF4293 family protein [Bacteroidaceae bacterium]|nr:DUF4293 family protein [Bacteroidaceae bacterium]
MKTYLHQVWLLLMCVLLFAGLLMPVGEFANPEGATASLTNFRINFIEGDSVSAMWALAVVLIVSLLVSFFELLLSGFRNFTLQKRILIFNALLLVGYYVIFIVYVLCAADGATFRPMWGGLMPLIALILDGITFFSVQRAEAMIIAGADSFRLRD